MRNLLSSLLASALLALPGITAAADPTAVIPDGGTSFKGFVEIIFTVMSKLIVPLLFSLAALAFLYGIVQYFIIGAANDEKRKQGRVFLLWGLVTLVVMFSAWGIVHTFLSTFGIEPSNSWIILYTGPTN